MTEDVLDAPPEPEGDDQDAAEGVEKPDISDDDEGETVAQFVTDRHIRGQVREVLRRSGFPHPPTSLVITETRYEPGHA